MADDTRRLLAVLALGLGVSLGNVGSAGAESLRVEPTELRLTDAYDGRQLVVVHDGAVGAAAGVSSEVDVTRQSRFVSSVPEVVSVDDRGWVMPRGVGTAVIRVEQGGAAVEVPVEVAALGTDRPIDFDNEVVPLLTRYGCNAGGCHGKASGQNGFKLSLFGFDPAYDYQAIVQEARGRRVFPAAARESLLLRKAAGQVPHGGGARLQPDGEAYGVLLRWIEQGMPRRSDQAREIVRVAVLPAQRVLPPGQAVQLRVLAEYSDGTTRDVTRQAQYETNFETVAAVDPTGYVTTTEQSGEAAIMVRYQAKVAVFRAVVPHGPPLAEIPGFAPRNEVDRLVAAKWKLLGLVPSPPADDATFLRRVTLDLCGRLPTVDEARQFLADTAADKRQRHIDRLLQTPYYASYFALRWGSILRNSPKAGADRAAYAFHNWIKDMVARNRPYDEFVRGIVAASGEWQDAPAINWYWQMRDDQLHQVTADTAQVFLGLRLQCAQCHHHPYERYSQDDYYGLAAFFMRVGRKSFGEPPPYYSAPRLTMAQPNPRTGQVPDPKFLDGPTATFEPTEDPRHALVDWMAQPDNPYFARALVNRLWGHFFARGIVDPVDDMRETNPPSNPELLDWLARDFVAHGFDVKHVVRTLVNSQVYQLSSEPTENNRQDRQNFARYYARRLIAEVFLDAVDQACGTQTRFSGVPSTARAIDLPHENFGSYFLDAFSRPRRESGCECERSGEATLSQVLLLTNSDEIENKLAAGQGRIADLVRAGKPDGQIIDELYLATFTRLPTAAEREKAVGYVASLPADQRQQAFEDLLWAILNSKEFCFNH